MRPHSPISVLMMAVAAGKVKTTGEIYKHKMQVNETSQPADSSASLAAASLKDAESVASDISSTAAVPAMPSLEQGRGSPTSHQQEVEQQQGEGEAEGGSGEGGREEEEIGSKTEDTEAGGGGESTSLPQNPEQ